MRTSTKPVHYKLMGVNTTHSHLLAIINTECSRFEAGSTLRILDAGCGSGALIHCLRDQLPGLQRGFRFEVFGFDVVDHGVRREAAPKDMDGVTWILASDPWPYPDGFFQIIVSNQVLEHVVDKDHFFSELGRTLGQSGFSAHLFPSKHSIWEPHIKIPMAHWIANRDLLCAYIKTMSRLGFGRFRAHAAALHVSIDEFAASQTDFILFFTRYMNCSEALDLAQKYRLRGSFRFTRELYTRKLRSVVSLPTTFEYSSPRAALWDWIGTLFLRYLSGITLFLEKRNTHRHGTEERVAAAGLCRHA